MALPPHAGIAERFWYFGHRTLCFLVIVFLIGPIAVIVPLSFNADNFFTFTPGMLKLDPDAYSLRHYHDFFFGANPWVASLRNSVVVSICATALATALGTLAALGLARPHMPWRVAITGILISPMIVPVVIAGVAMFFFYARIDLVYTVPGLILAHAALGTPFVVITVTATLSGFDTTLLRAAASCGSSPARTFFKVTLPVIMPGVVSGALFAFVTSFDEVVVALFLTATEQRTLPQQMWNGLREQISPTILAAATMLIAVAVALMCAVEMLRRRSERLRGLTPS